MSNMDRHPLPSDCESARRFAEFWEEVVEKVAHAACGRTPTLNREWAEFMLRALEDAREDATDGTPWGDTIIMFHNRAAWAIGANKLAALRNETPKVSS